MRDPVRWRDPSGAAPDGVRELLAGARKTRALTAAERARAAAHAAKLSALAKSAGAVAATSGIIGAAAIGAGTAVVLLGAIAILEPRPHPAEAPPEAAPLAASVAAPPSSPTISSPAPAEAPVVLSAVAPPAPAPPSANLRLPTEPQAPPMQADTSERDVLGREAALLGEAGALVTTRPREALALLEAHQRAFPKGKMGIEREVLTIDALLHAGRRDEARARGAALLAVSKGSFYEARVRRMLEQPGAP